MTGPVLPGSLLVATPTLTEPTFFRTVVLLLQAAPDEGALGVVLNRPLGTEVAEVLPGWDGPAAPPAAVFSGGPVSATSAICLGRAVPAATPDPRFSALEGLPGVGTVDLDADPGSLAVVSRVRVFAGYAGWAQDQLEGEIDEGAWFVVPALPSDAFAAEPEALWSSVLHRQGPPLSFVATYPADPTLN